jgi:mRNA-degrading endonuclease toxin of MazEF toxin-antitoxin module
MFIGNRGDVVVVLYPYDEGGGGAKGRPAVIIRNQTAEDYYICKVTTTDRSNRYVGRWILSGSPEGIKMGIPQNSFVNYENRTYLYHKFIYRKIGTYPFIEELENYLESIGEDIY